MDKKSQHKKLNFKVTTNSKFGVNFDLYRITHSEETTDDIDVSIYTPTYNHLPYLADYFDGVNKQITRYKVQIVIVDDFSETASFSELKRLARRSKHEVLIIRFHSNQHHSRVTKFLIGLSYSTGDFLAFCEADDYWLDEFKIQKQIDGLRKNPAYSWSMTHAEEKNIKNKSSNIIPALTPKDSYSNKLQILSLSCGQLPVCTMIFRKEVIVKFSDEVSNCYIQHTVEHLFIIIAFSMGECLFLTDITAVYRHGHPGSFTETTIQNKTKKMLCYQEISESYSNFAVKYGDANTRLAILRLVLWQSFQFVSHLYPYLIFKIIDEFMNDFFARIRHSKDQIAIIGEGQVYEFLLTNYPEFFNKIPVSNSDQFISNIKQLSPSRTKKMQLLITPLGIGKNLTDLIETGRPNHVTIIYHSIGDIIMRQLAMKHLPYLDLLISGTDVKRLIEVPTPASAKIKTLDIATR